MAEDAPKSPFLIEDKLGLEERRRLECIDRAIALYERNPSQWSQFSLTGQIVRTAQRFEHFVSTGRKN